MEPSGEEPRRRYPRDSADGSRANGEHRGSHAPPNAIARSYIQVAPAPHAKMDFLATFSPNSPPETFTDVPCGYPGGGCYAAYRQQSPMFDQMFLNAEFNQKTGDPLIAFGNVLGEFWVTYGDVGSGDKGLYRLTARQKANLELGSFLHVTMEVDAYSTWAAPSANPHQRPGRARSIQPREGTPSSYRQLPV